jgi:hypothetical protein
MNINLIKRVHTTLMLVMVIPLALILFAVARASLNMELMSQNAAIGVQLGFMASYTLVQIFAYLFGISYALGGYSKSGAESYKTFLLLYDVAKCLNLLATILYSGFGVVTVFLIVEILILGTLAFAKDLGRQTSMVLFCILLGCEVASGILPTTASGAAISIQTRLGDVLSRLVEAGTVGLAIKGKYDDKARRGTR